MDVLQLIQQWLSRTERGGCMFKLVFNIAKIPQKLTLIPMKELPCIQGDNKQAKKEKKKVPSPVSLKAKSRRHGQIRYLDMD